MNDGFVVDVTSLASGKWLLTLWKKYDNGSTEFTPDTVELIFDVTAYRTASTEKRAIKYAYKMLADVRKAAENRNRKSFEVK